MSEERQKIFVVDPIIAQRQRQQLDPSANWAPRTLRISCAGNVALPPLVIHYKKSQNTSNLFETFKLSSSYPYLLRSVMSVRCPFVVTTLLFPTATICFRENIKTRMSSTAHDPCVACLGRIQVAKGSLHSSTRILCPVLLASPEHVFFHRLTLSLTVTPTTTRY